MSHSHEHGLYRRLSDRGVPIPHRITATDLRRDLREVLARVEYSDWRIAVIRQGRPVAAVLPLAHLRQLEEFERTGIRYHREYLSTLADLQRARAALGE
jgi:prevent-host-death family protein